MQQEKIVLVGGGQAAVQMCLALRKEKVTTPVLLLSEEGLFPYHRPPLSKSFLSGETDEDKLAMRPESFYESKDVDVQLNTRVTGIDLQAQKVITGQGSHNYQSLVLVTGARPRPLPIPGASSLNAAGGVHLLRDLHHSKAIRDDLARAKNVVVIGAGFIGLEFAAVANKAGKQVTVFDMAGRVMERAVSPDVSSWFEQTHRAQGITLRMNDSVKSILGNDRVEQVETSAGERLDCDLIVIGVGVVPNDDIAKSAGIECDDGIIVNETCETSVPHIYAAGDCAKHPNPFADGAMIRLESIQNATDQARTVAASIAGRKAPYHSVPWFWSDQGEHSLQMAGLSNSSDQFVVRGKPADDAFSVFHYLGGKLQSVDSVNSPREHMIARKLIGAGISPGVEQAADMDFDLKSLIS